MDIPLDVIKFHQIQYLPVSDILHLCRTSSELRSVCQDNQTWQYLIQRDFDYEYLEDDPRDEYLRAYRARKMSLIKETNIPYYVKLVLYYIGFRSTSEGWIWLQMPEDDLYEEMELADLYNIQSILFQEGVSFGSLTLLNKEEVRKQVKELLPSAFHVRDNLVTIKRSDFLFLRDYWSPDPEDFLE